MKLTQEMQQKIVKVDKTKSGRKNVKKNINKLFKKIISPKKSPQKKKSSKKKKKKRSQKKKKIEIECFNSEEIRIENNDYPLI